LLAVNAAFWREALWGGGHLGLVKGVMLHAKFQSKEKGQKDSSSIL